MKLLIIAGFLGSGKTTLLLQIARKLTAIYPKIAIIENEVGEIGVDDRYLRLEGLQVQELFGGCICCTLSADLVSTLEKIERLYQPNLTIMEPTGLALPGDIVRTISKYAPMVSDISVILLVDAARYEMLHEMLTPLTEAQIRSADIVAINKIDASDGAVVESVGRNVSQLNPRAKVMEIAAEKGTNLEPLLMELQ